ncbi:hypothetical protein GCM10009677_48550 [Sphaerisporangium rubeum]|uniref:Signal transduction histidine-protein kinase/phosphatase MprB n=1 Tax=Sphaerisporangium rubeum TaxID=321317 RepID=A0A7X0I935_9ACTN|nr:DUF4153 domain-containing protein [Sphaerisporangium rubeum]MBB6470891.1 signal transduction histidine kinase [Sphaerisporangium rubeum]
MRPLDFLGRIKVKLGIVIVLTVVTAFAVNEVGIGAGWPRDARIAVAAVLALIMVQLLAMGMTRPLREMAAAAQTIAKGRYGLRVSATSRDEVGELARAFNAMAADLGEVDRQRRELVANVSHELRTPIAGLQAVLENIVDGVSTPDLGTLGTALAQTQRLGRLTTQLLDLSRLDSGARLIEPEAVDLASLCHQAASEAAFGRDDVTVVSTVGEASLSADPALLAQVLANLLDNAVRHSPPGGTVRIAARHAGPVVEISVIDQGPGIPVAERTRVFERFSRLDAGRAAGAGGAGLGLAIAKEIVELHDGSISVTGAPPAGSGGTGGCRMVVTLPAALAGTVLPAVTETRPGAGTAPRTPAVEPVTETATELVTEPAIGPVAEPAIGPVTEPATEPATESATGEGARRGPEPASDVPVRRLAQPPGSGVTKGDIMQGPASEQQVPASAGPSRQDEPARTVPAVYVPPPIFPRPELPGVPDWLLPAAAAVGLVATVALPDPSTGLGLVLTAVALGAAIFPALLPLRRGRLTPWTVTFGVLAYALVSLTLYRDTDWVVAPALLLAFGIAALGLSGAGRGWPGLLIGAASVALSTLLLPWFLATPLKRLRGSRRVVPVLAGTAITVVLLSVFGLLFGSADAVFHSYVSGLLQAPEWVDRLPSRVFLLLVFAVLTCAGVLVTLRPAAEPQAPDLRVRLDRAVWMMPLTALNLLFAAFVAVQITVLFGGSRRVLSTAGLTYAEYARSGFFELVTVSVFVLGIVAASTMLLRPTRPGDRWPLTVLLGLLCALTLVVLASALHRLDLYTDAYGLSRLRAAVAAAIWWLAAVFVVVIAAGVARLTDARVTWLPRMLVLLTGVTVFTFAVWNPEARVAETQMAVRGVSLLDQDYLGDLGPEAVPVLDRLPEPARSCVLRDVVSVNRLDHPDPWNAWNLARVRAREVLERHPVLARPDCPSRDDGGYPD